MIFSVAYLLVRRLLGCLMVLAGFGRAGAGDLGFVVSVAARSTDRYWGAPSPCKGPECRPVAVRGRYSTALPAA